MGLENTTAKYTVQIVQDGTIAPAVAEFNKLREAAQQAAGGTHTATAGLHELRETSMLTRESTRLLNETMIMFGGTGLGEVAKGALLVSEGMKGARTAAMLFGLSISEVLLPLTAVAAAVGGGYLLWESYGDHMESAEAQAKNLATALEKLPAMLKEINDAQNVGMISNSNAQKYQDELTGATPLYQFQGKVTTDKYLRAGRNQIITGEREPATQEQIQAYVQMQQAADKFNATQVAAANELKQLHDRDTIDQLSGYEKERSAENQRYQDELQHIKILHETAIAAGGKDNSGAGAAADARHSAALSAISNKQDEELQRTYNQALAEEDALWKQIETDEKRAQAEKTAALAKATQAQQQLNQLEQKITLENLTGEARKKQAIIDTTNAQITQFQKLGTELGLSQQEIDAWVAKIKTGAQISEQAVQDTGNHLKSISDMSNQVTEDFSSGFASAFVQFAEGTKSAGQAFADFAAQFLSHLAEMIIQQEIFNAIKAAGMFFGGGGSVTADALGGVHYAANGIMSVSSPTFFPKFNVVAGEAGQEMLTVLARPTFRSIGGIDAVVGNAGNNRLAITNADDLASRGGGYGGGVLHIQIDHTPETQATIVRNSVKGAVTEVTNQLTRHSPISKAVKNLTA